jgi:hypothetical protein
MLLIAILIVPFIVGCGIVFLKNEAVHRYLEDFHVWLIRNEGTFFPRKGKLSYVSRYTLEPLYSLLIAVNDWTENIGSKGLKSGIRVASYLYFVGFIVFILLTLGPFILLLALLTSGIVLLLFGVRYVKARKRSKSEHKSVPQPQEESLTFVETFWPHFRARNTVNKVEELFAVEQLEVTYHGDIFTNDISQYSVRTKIGIVDKNGGIYDTREETPLKIGSVDTLGNVIDERNWRMDDIIF